MYTHPPLSGSVPGPGTASTCTSRDLEQKRSMSINNRVFIDVLFIIGFVSKILAYV